MMRGDERLTQLSCQLLRGLNPAEIRALSYEWRFWARAAQLPPKGDWRVWLLMAGRGFGKTRTGAEWVRALATSQPRCEIGLIGATFDDVRHVMVDGPSGIVTISPPEEGARYYPSRHQILWPNGTKARLFAADRPSQLRGPEFHFIWADEIAKWRYREAWDNAMMALRKGVSPRVLATTTPRPLPWLSALAQAQDTVLVTGKSQDNAANLAQGFMAAMRASYGDSALARQELDGELLAELPDALWQRAQLEAVTMSPPPRGDFIRLVVGVDPAIGGANETGIIVAGKDKSGHIWVLGDYSAHAPPDIWARHVRQAFAQWRADCVVVEVNQGGDLVAHLLRHNGPTLPLRQVRAVKSKAMRAEPVAAAYARGEVSHGADMPKLVEQMVNFTPQQKTGLSPDRLDAAIWAITSLLSGTQVSVHEMRL